MGEIITVVNEKDEIINYKDINSLKLEDIYRVSALWITNSNGEILLARRSAKGNYDPGKWGPAVAGTVAKGESYRENIIKEAEEELGLTNITPIKGSKSRSRGKHNFFVQWFTLTVDKNANDFKIKKDEVQKIKWFTKKELRKKVNSNRDGFVYNMEKYLDLFI